MARHPFNFDGGEDLTTMGATWFVSYMWYSVMDPAHKNWKHVSTYKNRISTYEHTKHYHVYWLKKVLEMDVNNLNKNTIGLNGHNVIAMAGKLLTHLQK